MAAARRSWLIAVAVLVLVILVVWWGTLGRQAEMPPPVAEAPPASAPPVEGAGEPAPPTVAPPPAAGNGAPATTAPPDEEPRIITRKESQVEIVTRAEPEILAQKNGAADEAAPVYKNGATEMAPPAPVYKNGETMAEPPVAAMPPAAANGAGEHTTAAAPAAAAPDTLARYKVELGADAHLQRPGPPGELTVWIGDPAFSPEFRPEMATTETTVPAIGQTARVTPLAPDFEVSPSQSICMKIHPTGSEAHFFLTPKTTGTFNVGAEVLLFESADCQGAPVPKSAATLKVEVVVNKGEVAQGYLLQLWDILWQGVLDFWKWLVAAIVALLIFLTRKRLKKWFGFDAPEGGGK